MQAGLSLLNSNWTGIQILLETSLRNSINYSALKAANMELFRFTTKIQLIISRLPCGGIVGRHPLLNLLAWIALSKLQVVQERRLLAESGQISMQSFLASD